MAGKLYNLARMTTAATGTSRTAVTLGAAVTGFLSFGDAGVQDGETIQYGIEDGSNREVGEAVYTASGTSLNCTVIKSTNSDAAINLSGSAQVFITPLAHALTSRELLTAARTYYVDGTSGSDSNDGLSSGAGAFATIQKAIDTAASLDISIYDVTINVAAGTYAEALTLKHLVGAGVCYIVGDEVTLSNVVIAPTSGICFTAASIFSTYYLRGMSLNPVSGSGVSVSGPGKVIVRNLSFGAGTVHLTTQPGGIIESDGDYTIAGGATYHWLSSGMIDIRGRTITITGTPAFGTTGSSGFASAIRGGGIICFSNTFSGSATGRRYFASGNGFIDSNGAGATYLPGDSAGTTTTGGQYV